jgi:hypothetical protein
MYFAFEVFTKIRIVEITSSDEIRIFILISILVTAGNKYNGKFY